MRFAMNKAVVAVALVAAAVLATDGTALATHKPGAEVIGTGIDNYQGGAYAIARDNARNQCQSPNNVSRVAWETRREPDKRWWAMVVLRCN